jgi:transposase
MAFQRSRRSGLAGNLVETRTHEGGVEGTDQQARPQRCARHRADERAGLYRPVHVKTLRSQKLRMLLTHRKLLQSKAIAIENDLRATLRNFGLKVGMVGADREAERFGGPKLDH